MTVAGKTFKPLLYPSLIGICLVISFGLLYINFSDFVMPFAVVVALLIICSLIGLISYVAYCRAPRHNHKTPAKFGRAILLVILGVVVIILIALPVLVIQNA